MRHSMGLIPFFLAFGALPALATPAYYTINFSLTQDGPVPSGSFLYDSSTSTFASFDVAWDGYTFDLTSAANSLTFTSPTDPCYSGSTNGAQEAFLLLTTCATDANPAYYTAAPYFLANVYPYGSPNYTAFGIGTTAITNPGPNQINVYGPAEGTSLCPPDTCYTYSGQAVGNFESIATPEPGSCALMLIGLSLVVRKLRRGARASTRVSTRHA